HAAGRSRRKRPPACPMERTLQRRVFRKNGRDGCRILPCAQRLLGAAGGPPEPHHPAGKSPPLSHRRRETWSGARGEWATRGTTRDRCSVTVGGSHLRAKESLTSMNIHWLEKTKADLPAENQWLNANETLRLNAMRIPKRRADWRLGRWTAKHAVAACLNLSTELSTLADI